MYELSTVNILLNPLNTELNPICHLLALLGGATIVVVSRLRVNPWDLSIQTRSEIMLASQMSGYSTV
jgi:hypothetical protein